MTPAAAQAVRAVPKLPRDLQSEDLPTIKPPPVPSALEIITRAYDGNHTLEWFIVETILRTVAQAFPYFSEAKRLRQWAQARVNLNLLRDPPPEGCVLLNTPALELKHPELPKGRTYLLVPGGAGRETYCVVVLDHAHLAQANQESRPVAFNSFHIAALGIGTIFAPAICRLVFETVGKAAIFTEAHITYRVSAALRVLEEELKQLWTLRGLTW
ncbi:hypothetical protein HYW17_02585 [Candidatus Uhrbacteria bacterium]|nr:hypothetical protein [Candidatus Uhrbacteria bacterium]